MTKYEMGLKMAKLAEENLALRIELGVAKTTVSFAAAEIIKENSEQALKLLENCFNR